MPIPLIPAHARRRWQGILALLLAVMLAGCTGTLSGVGDVSEGEASYYSDAHQGARTASGERYARSALPQRTAAWPSAPGCR